jgi:putative transposase
MIWRRTWAIGLRCPAELYRPSSRRYLGLPELDYPFHDKAVNAKNQSQHRLCSSDRRIRQVDDRIWLVSFMHSDLGYFDDETCRLEPLRNPFGPKVLPMSPV